jgi:hypothetical protein
MKYLRFFILAAAAGAVLILAFQRAHTNQTAVQSKINGVSLEAPPRIIDVNALRPIKEVNANWIAITPYAFSRPGNPEVTFNYPRQWWGEREEGAVATINYAKELGLKVMLKPHVWVRGDGWAGDFAFDNETDWRQWEENYREYIISYAKVADSLNVEMLCIGTEFRKAAVQRPDLWRSLAKEIRTFYDGDITYAANWDNYQNINFWDDMDYIGVDAYFPLSEQKNPGVDHLKQQWQPVKQDLRQYAKTIGKPMLFTEFGYESIDFAADGHWKHERNVTPLNLQAQANAYQGLFRALWDEPWFAGGFVWKWHARHGQSGAPDNKRFTPQNKPAEETIRSWFGRYSVGTQ